METYAFTEEQALAASAKINDDYLIFLVKEVKRLAKLVATPQLPDFTNPSIAARAWADEYEAKQIAQKAVVALEEKLVEAKPKMVTFLSQIGSLTMGNQLKVPIMPRKEALMWLQEKGYICKSKVRACSSSSKPGNEWCFEVKEFKQKNTNKLVYRTLITKRGQIDLWSKMLKDLRGDEYESSWEEISHYME